MSIKPHIVIRGAENSENEVSRQQITRDTRSLPAQFWDFLSTRDGAVFALVGNIVLCLFVPVSSPFCLLLALVVLIHRNAAINREHLPFRMPVSAHCTDLGDPLPGRKAFGHSSGLFYVGQERSGKQLWLKAKDVLTHMLVFGTTGSGKTEFLISLAFNALALGSGFVYVDPKGAPKLPFQVFTMCRMLGRDDDFRLMNFNTGGKSVSGRTPKRMSNTQNPFAFAGADAIQQLIVSLIPKSEGGNAIFAQNAQVIISGLIYGLVDLRDQQLLNLSTQTINDYLNLVKADELARNPALSPKAMLQVRVALRTVGWREEMPLEEQLKTNKALNEQFGYARAYFGLFLTQLGYTYGYIFNHQVGEIDMFDIIMQRRILVVILPSLEKSPQELESLGKITLSSIRNATAVGLGSKIQGTAEDVLFSLPTDSPIPFMSITDEYAAIPTPGYAEVLTQGRGLGIAAIVASQDYAGIEESDRKGAQQIVANTKVKFCMKLEDPKGTWDLFKGIAAEGFAVRTDGYEGGQESLGYVSKRSASIQSESRIHIRDLQEQTEGEFHSFFNGEIVRGSGFYADPVIKAASQLRLPCLLPILRPDVDTSKREQAAHLAEQLENLIRESLETPQAMSHLFEIPAETDNVLKRLSELFRAFSGYQIMEKVILVFMGNAHTPESITRFEQRNVVKDYTDLADQDCPNLVGAAESMPQNTACRDAINDFLAVSAASDPKGDDDDFGFIDSDLFPEEVGAETPETVEQEEAQDTGQTTVSSTSRTKRLATTTELKSKLYELEG